MNNTQNGNELATTDEVQEIVPRPAERVRGISNQRGLQLTTMREMMDFSSAVAQSGLAPKGLESQQKIFVAVAMGAELGLSPMQSIQNIGVINGKPGPYGDAVLGLVRATGAMPDFQEWWEDEKGNLLSTFPANAGDGIKAVCLSRRMDQKEPKITYFSVADARKAALWTKQGPWAQYPGRMLMFRARGFNLRDQFPEILKGVKTYEELSDYPDESTPDPGTEPPVGRQKVRKGVVMDAETVEPTEAEPEYSQHEVAEAPTRNAKPAQKTETANDNSKLNPMQELMARCGSAGICCDASGNPVVARIQNTLKAENFSGNLSAANVEAAWACLARHHAAQPPQPPAAARKSVVAADAAEYDADDSDPFADLDEPAYPAN